MTFVTVFWRVPRPITGMIGILSDSDFERFESNLDWLETTGVLVEQFDPWTAASEVAKRPAVRQILSDEGEQALPLILVNEGPSSIPWRPAPIFRASWCARSRPEI
jgi:hypothetical protein